MPLDSHTQLMNTISMERNTIPNVLSASRPSVNQDGENKPFFTSIVLPRIPSLIQRNAHRHVGIG